MLIQSLKGAAAATLVCGLGMLGASQALAANAEKTVPGGIDAAAIPHAQVFGNTPADTPETVSFIFKIQNESTLATAVENGSLHAPFMSVADFAGSYGQPSTHIAALQSYLAPYGIQTTVYANDIDVVATGTAGQFDKALSVTQKQYQAPAARSADGAPVAGQTFHGVSSDPSLPKSIAQNLVAILGLTNYAPSVSNAKAVDRALVAKGKKGGPAETCQQLSGLPDDCNLPSDFASNYGLNGLYGAGTSGNGQTLGIVTLATVDTGAPQYFWSNIANVPRTGSLTYDNVDGGAGAPSYDAGTGETDLDIEQSGALAPAANIVVYTAPNTDSGFIDAFFTAATQDSAGSVSCSWGEAETLIKALQAEGGEPSGYIAAYDEALLELAAQGQASFVASGDGGAYDAYGEFPGTDQPTNLSVDNPSDSPFTTAAGGTTLPWTADLGHPKHSKTDVTVTVPAQRIWGWDYLWQPLATLDGTDLLTAAESAIAGSGGGFSAAEQQPSYQSGVSGTSSFTAVPWLTPTGYSDEYGISLPMAWTLNANPQPTPGTPSTDTGTGRATPDLAADADPYSGYVEYAPSDAHQDGDPSATQYGWGGTSFVAPELNGAAAVIDSYVGQRTGFWNPAIYKFAQSATSTPFTPLGTSGTSNDNLYYTGTPGVTFDPGAGLGTPDLTTLGADFKSAP